MEENLTLTPSPESKSGIRNSDSFQEMMQRIKTERSKESMINSTDGFEMMNDSTHFWTDLFTKYFIDPSKLPDDQRDDMLFYVRKTRNPKHKSFTFRPEIEVYRRDSKSLPLLEEKTIDWEETVYLNIISHQLVYTATCAVCTRTSEKHLQILRRFSQRVYPSPSKRRMDDKGTEEELTYPNIYFTVDNFEEAFGDIVVRDSEMVCVELTATDRHGRVKGVIFLGSVRYEVLKKVYDARLSLTSKMMQTMSLGMIKQNKRVEFVRMRGPKSKGHAEVAVSRVPGSGPETPNKENFKLEDFNHEQSNEQNEYTHRRMSDPSESFGSFVRGGIRRLSLKKSRSEAEDVNAEIENCQEVEATTPQRELERSTHANGFLGKAFGQAWMLFKEQKRVTSVALNAYLTYITLPWHWIIAGRKIYITLPWYWIIAGRKIYMALHWY
ncbi:uncharacterized protein KIAA0930 homolog isoform X2 [Ostrea edulis]|uniref:uncharacterized protein KIAA0930 homolog isoform X2 n=1 Tax=Ostrea edulis TaxID=37623 RepID=UPI0024AF2A29|nr:uncharacterized protein KIAA0930 homolog isoform X2 [Ostrea edulis]